MSLSEISAEVLLPAGKLPEYKDRIEWVWKRMVGLHTCFFILERIADYPFEIVDLPPHIFWNALKTTLLEACILRTWQLTEDEGGEQLASLTKLRDFVVVNVLPTYRPMLLKALGTETLSAETKNVIARVEKLRHALVAHIDGRLSQTELSAMQLSSVESLGRAIKELDELFQVLCCDSGRSALPLPYAVPIGGKEAKTDVDDILSKVAAANDVIGMPEKQPGLWELYKAKMNGKELDILNRWRAKVGLEKA